MDFKDISTPEQFVVKSARGKSAADTATSSDATALAAMIDYAIAEGAEMRLPLFVYFLRLALKALEAENKNRKQGDEDRRLDTPEVSDAEYFVAKAEQCQRLAQITRSNNSNSQVAEELDAISYEFLARAVALDTERDRIETRKARHQ